ncbi:hypothetical protein BC833DRAFT_516548, partial [Globomyces pollinis-pini]
QVDPFFLRNHITSYDDSNQFALLSKKLQRATINQSIYQLGMVFACLGCTHLGVPWAISIPSAVLGSGFGLAWMNLRYKSIQTSFLNNLSEVHQSLKYRLLVI